jgi:hypothetical protein
MPQQAEVSDLEPFEALVGTWTTEAIHPIYPTTVVRGRTKLSRDGSSWDDDLSITYRRVT